MTDRTANDLGAFVWAVIMVAAFGMLGCWLVLTVTGESPSQTPTRAHIIWMSPDDFVGDEASTQAAQRLVSKVTAPAEAAVSTEPAVPVTPPLPGVKVSRVLSSAGDGADPDASGLTELTAYDGEIEHTLQNIWTPPSLNEVPKGFDRMTVKLTLTRDGSIIKSEEVETSGHTAMDRSVRYAVALFINAGRAVPASHPASEYEVVAEFRLR